MVSALLSAFRYRQLDAKADENATGEPIQIPHNARFGEEAAKRNGECNQKRKPNQGDEYVDTRKQQRKTCNIHAMRDELWKKSHIKHAHLGIEYIA